MVLSCSTQTSIFVHTDTIDSKQKRIDIKQMSTANKLQWTFYVKKMVLPICVVIGRLIIYILHLNGKIIEVLNDLII